MSETLTITPALGSAIVTATEAATLRRDELLHQAALVTTIVDRIDADSAIEVLRSLKQFTTEIETQRKAAKEPALEIGKKIDALAKSLVAQVAIESDRIARNVGAFEQAERERADEERRRAECEAARIAAEAQQQADAVRRAAPDALTADRRADEVTAQAAEQIVALKQQATNSITVKPADSQLRGTICFEVIDIKALYASEPNLVTLEPNGTAIRAIIKANPNIQIPGLRHWKETKLNVR